jgi:putative PIN family toxin of toxin-antitoxin system
VKVVLDTNVLLASVATHGLCAALVELILRDHVLISSEYILNEFEQHYIGKFKVSIEQAEAAVKNLRALAEIVQPVEVPHDAFSDSDDLPVLGTALAAHVEYLVTGDRELLELKSFESISVVSPRQFYELIRDKSD